MGLLSTKPQSLRRYLLRPFLLLVLTISVLLIGVSTVMGHYSTQQSVEQLSQQISETVRVKLERLFGGMVSLLRINQRAFEMGLLSFENKEGLQQQFAIQADAVPYVTFISAVDVNGEYTGAARKPDTNELQIMTAYVSDERILSLYQANDKQQRGALIRKIRLLDARTRPWYQQAYQNQKIAWYPAYKYVPYSGMGMGVVAPVLNQQSKLFSGVVTVDLALDKVSQFLRSLSLGKHGVAFLMDDKGKLVATSLDKPVYSGDGDHAVQHGLTTYPDGRLQAIADIVQPQGQFTLRIDGADYVLHKQVIQDQYGLYFVMGVLLANADFSAELDKMLWLQLAVFLLLLLIALVMMRKLVAYLARPIEQLTHQVQAVAHTKWGSDGAQLASVAELDKLAQAVNSMSDNLRNAFLQQEQTIAERTAALTVANAQLQALSITDTLTGLANRRGFDERYIQLQGLALRNCSSLSVLMMDVDWFKRYNDHYGHVAGDACLAAVASALKGALRRQVDLLARYGGEEFVVVLYDTDSQAAQQIAQKMLDAVRDIELEHVASSYLFVTISVGVATRHSSDVKAFTDLLDRADAALYSAKEQGRNTLVVAEILS